MISPPRSARIWYPDCVALAPPTTWNHRGRKTTGAKNAIDAMNIAMTEIVNERLRKSSSGTMGSTARDSTQTKSAVIASPARISPPTAGSAQLPLCSLVSPTRIGTSAATRTVAPR